MVVDPENGRVPVRPWAEAKRDYDLAHLGDSYVHETPWVRCITRGMPAGMFPAGVQQRVSDYSDPWICRDLLRDDSRDAHHPAGRPSTCRQEHQAMEWRFAWSLGKGTRSSSKRRTITTRVPLPRARRLAHPRGIPQSEALHVVERFTPVDANRINYDVTITDPERVLRAPGPSHCP